jgi:hypothetical protein
MVQQLIFDAKLLLDTKLFPVSYGWYYQSDNAYIYGVMGKPLVWYYANLLPVVGSTGFAYYFISRALKKQTGGRFRQAVCLAVIMVTEYLSIRWVHSSFIQYYLPVTWLYCMGTALLVADLVDLLLKRNAVARMALVSFLVVCAVCGRSIVHSTVMRSQFNNADFGYLTKIWTLIPPDQPVFTGFLFRPPAHAVGYGYFYPETSKSILNRYPSVIQTLETGKVKYAFISQYMLSFFDDETKQYIAHNYHVMDGYDGLLVRN